MSGYGCAERLMDRELMAASYIPREATNHNLPCSITDNSYNIHGVSDMSTVRYHLVPRPNLLPNHLTFYLTLTLRMSHKYFLYAYYSTVTNGNHHVYPTYFLGRVSSVPLQSVTKLTFSSASLAKAGNRQNLMNRCPLTWTPWRWTPWR